MNRFISWAEVRLGMRLIAKQPVVSITIILALATGICLTTMGFTFRDELMNGKLPYQAGDRFARVHVLSREGNPIRTQRRAVSRDPRSRRRLSSMSAPASDRSRWRAVPVKWESIGTYSRRARCSGLDPPLAGRTLIPADGESRAPSAW
jgi:hypothetical protein